MAGSALPANDTAVPKRSELALQVISGFIAIHRATATPHRFFYFVVLELSKYASRATVIAGRWPRKGREATSPPVEKGPSGENAAKTNNSIYSPKSLEKRE